MINSINNTIRLCTMGLRLGATLMEKLRLSWFVTASRLLHQKVKSKTFNVRVEGRTMQIVLRNNFADAFVLNEALIERDYRSGLPEDAPKVIFDIGANIGFVTLYFKARFPDAQIFCFEPDPDNFALLEENTKGLSNVRCFKLAVGARKESRTFYRNPHFHMRNSLVANEGGEAFPVEVVSLEDAFVLAGVSSVDLLKVDVEGAEAEIFSAFNEFQKISALVGELHPHLLPHEAYRALRERLEREYDLVVREEGKKVFIYGTKR